jgi:hypothetical protein
LVCEPGKLLAAAADRLLVGFKKTLSDDRISERVADLAIEAVNDRGRCAGRNERAHPLTYDQTSPEALSGKMAGVPQGPSAELVSPSRLRDA